MPSFIIHHISGERLLNNLNLNEEDRLLFLLGNLIPDSSKNNKKDIQKEKLITHFRRIEDNNKLLMAPYPEDFLNKYKNIINNPTVLGYYFHLWMDKYYFNNIFKSSFIFLDKNYKETNILSENVYIKIIKNNKLITRKELFSQEYLYDDYTTMNKILLDRYNISFNIDEYNKIIPKFINPGIEEVDYKNVKSIIIDMLFYINESKKRKETNLKVLDEDKIIKLIEDASKTFIEENKDLLKGLII